MHAKILAALAALVVAAAPFAAQAGEVQNRINNQHARINQGIGSGQVTRGEDRNLSNRESSIEAQRNRDLYRNGGTLTRGERRNLNARENRLSNSIYYDKHNFARQPGTPRD